MTDTAHGAWLREETTHSVLLLSAILLLALALRVGMGVFLGFDAPPDFDACGADAVEFEHMAWSFSQGHGLVASPGGGPTAFRAPGYPLALGTLYALFGRRYFVNRIFLSLVGTLTCWLVYVLARRLELGRWAALLAAGLTAVLPLQFYWCGHFMSDPLAILLNVLCALFLAVALGPDAARGRRLAFLALAGVANGASALVRPAALLMPVCLAPLLFLGGRRTLGSVLAHAALLAFATALVIAPWTLRNGIVFHRFCLIASSGGAVFWGANNAAVATPSQNWGAWISNAGDRQTKDHEVLSLPNEIDRDRKEWALGMRFLRAQPARIPMLVLGKIYRLLTPLAQSPNRVYVLVVAVAQSFLLPASLTGLVLVLRSGACRARLVPVLSQLLVLLSNTAVFYGHERFRAGYEPFLAILAAVALTGTRLWPKHPAAAAPCAAPPGP